VVPETPEKVDYFCNFSKKWSIFVFFGRAEKKVSLFEYHITLFAHLTPKTKKTTAPTNYHLCKIKLVIFEI